MGLIGPRGAHVRWVRPGDRRRAAIRTTVRERLSTGKPGTVSRVERPRTTRGDDLITALLSAWLVVGLFIDGWAHNNLEALETFLTSWHAALYSGFAATAAWMGWLVLREIRR